MNEEIVFFLDIYVDRPRKLVEMTENEIRGLCLKSREIFLSQPVLLELKSPVKVCGIKKFIFFLYYSHIH